MIEKTYAYSKKKRILEKCAFLPPPTATNPLKSSNSSSRIFLNL